ncbi:MAG: zinc ribbon domain-containing protein [Proteobacteria bacterium]|nr:zinc ribbon domain-containing protein [Pseudomonadota bacterium]
MAETRTIAAPHVELETQEYWDALKDGKLLLKKCRSCNASHHYPRSTCPHCGSSDTFFEETNGKGTIYSYSVMRRVPDPYAIAYVTLDGTDVTMMTNIINCDLNGLSIGQAVRFVSVETETAGTFVPMFEPA